MKLTKTISRVFTMTIIIILSSLCLIGCKKDEDKNKNNNESTGSITSELATYIGKTRNDIADGMKEKGYLYNSEDENYERVETGEMKYYYFGYNGSIVSSAMYGKTSRETAKRDAYLNQAIIWGDECVSLKYNDSYNGYVVTASREYDADTRSKFKDLYNEYKSSLVECSESWKNKEKQMYAETGYYKEGSDYSVYVGLSSSSN